jgi:peptide/nickel transport system permease protein
MTQRSSAPIAPATTIAADAWQPLARPASIFAAVAAFARAKPMGAFGGLVVVMLVVVALLANVLAPENPIATNQRMALRPPSAEHLLGTDQFGRDILSRVIFGARVSLFVGVGVTLIALSLAVMIGVSSAYFGGAVDYGVQRLVDSVQAVPGLILLISVLVVLGPSVTNVVLALAFRSAITTSRVVRGATLGVIAHPYVEAAKVLGGSDLRIMARHVVPNIIPPAIIVATVQFGGTILAEASLSFLGYGVPPPTPTWGGMLSAEGRAYMIAAPWILIAPAVALSLVVFSVNMLGDALRDRLDPRLRGGGGRMH